MDHLVEHDGGSRSRLCAAGRFTPLNGVVANGIACFDGSAWSGLSWPSLYLEAGSVLRSIHDDQGPGLYVGSPLQSAGGVACNGIARWNGSARAPIGLGLPSPMSHVSGLEWFDVGDGAGPASTVAGRKGNDSVLMQLRGGTWTPLSSTVLGTGARVQSLAIWTSSVRRSAISSRPSTTRRPLAIPTRS